MAKFNLNNYDAAADGFDFVLNFRRSNPNPLDNSSVWASYEEALDYAINNSTAYVGQVLSVVEQNKDTREFTVSVYVIADEAGTLNKISTGTVSIEALSNDEIDTVFLTQE